MQVEKLAAEDMKRTWTEDADGRDWTDPEQGTPPNVAFSGARNTPQPSNVAFSRKCVCFRARERT